MKPKEIASYLDSASQFLVLATIFLLPLFFNPLTANLFDLNKQLLLAVSTGLLLVIWMIRNMITKSFHITITPVTGALLLFVFSLLVSSLSPTLPRTIETFVAVANFPVFLLLFFIIATSLKTSKGLSKKVIVALVASAAFLAVLAVLETVGFGPGKIITQVNNTQVNPEVFISPAGSAVILISFLIPMLILSLVLAITQVHMLSKTFFFASSALITSALVISAFTILPGKPNAPIFLPFGVSWQIAAENVKSPKKFLIGVGTNNYVQAFSTNKTAQFNQYEFWNTRFNVARNYPLHLFTTAGLFGIVTWSLLLFMLFRLVRKIKEFSWVGKASFLALGTILFTIFIIPSNSVLFACFVFLMIALMLDLKEKRHPLVSELMLKLFAAKLVDSKEAQDESKKLKTEVLPIVIGVPVIILMLFTFYGSFRVLAADMAYRQSLVAATQNNGSGTYDKQRQAIQLNPYMSSYHRAYANTNLALANSIGAKENISDADKETVSTLIRQAIREGQNSVQINPTNPANWETLAVIYRNLINVADGATQWAVSSYSQAISLDPTNPRLWLDVGGVFFQLQNYPQAIETFQRAVALKPDWANAHYNLANAYKENQELERAVAQYEAVLQLVSPSSADYNRALEELNTLKEQLGQDQTESKSQSTELSSPEPIPSPIPGSEGLELTDEDAPPAGETTDNPGFGDITNQEASESGETVE